MLVFRKAYGALAGLFKPRCAPDLVRETNCDLATRVLADIIVPAINLVDVQGAGRDADAKTRLAACLERISDNRHDLEFYAALLCRYVAQSQAAGHISRHPSARFGQQFLGYADAQLG